jgi:hypothetical protein
MVLRHEDHCLDCLCSRLRVEILSSARLFLYGQCLVVERQKVLGGLI